MSLKVESGSAYQEAANHVGSVKGETNAALDTEEVKINITEVPAELKTSGNKQTGKSNEKGQKENSASEQQIKDAISKANNKLKGHRTKFEFSYHEETKRISIKVLDKDTEEVIREIPPEETLEMLEKMWELAGILIDEKR